MKNFLLIFLLSSSASFATDIDQKPFYLPNTEIDVSSYKIHLKVSELAPIDLPAEVILKLTALASINSIKLHASKMGMEISETRVNGVASHSHFANAYVLEIDLPKALRKGDQAEVHLSYVIKKAQLQNKEKQGLFFSKSWKGIPVLSVEDWPHFTRTWVPSNDNPADPATFELLVDIPKGLKAMSNGDLIQVDTSQPNSNRFHWKTRTAFPTYDLNLVIGKYKEYKTDICFSTTTINDKFIPCAPGLSSSSVQFYAPDNGNDHTTAWLSVKEAARSVPFFSSVLGEYRFEKIAFVSAPQSILMEYPSLITADSGSVHELAHQWFGNSVWIQHWGDLWISEGFTTYLDEVLYEEFKSRPPFVADKKRLAPFNFVEETAPLSIFDDGPYHSGASAIGHLRNRLATACAFEGKKETEMFYAVVRSIYQAYKLRPLGTTELVNFLHTSLPKTLGKQNCVITSSALSQLIDQWQADWLDTL